MNMRQGTAQQGALTIARRVLLGMNPSRPKCYRTYVALKQAALGTARRSSCREACPTKHAFNESAMSWRWSNQRSSASNWCDQHRE